MNTVQVDGRLLERLNDYCACASLVAPLVPTSLEGEMSNTVAAYLGSLVAPEGLACRMIRTWNGWGVEYYRVSDGLPVILETRS